jgi:hypothetical protein
MRALMILILSSVVLAACTPAGPPPSQATVKPVSLVTPGVPAGASFYDGCTHMLSYPSELDTSDGILFQSPSDQDVYVLIIARRRAEGEEDLSLDGLASQTAARWSAQANGPVFEAVQVTDYLGTSLDGLRSDLVDEAETHTRLMVVVRPETLLGDMLPADVVYEIVAQAPEAIWSEWDPLFEIVFQTFHPKDCGGV